ncbi:PKD domain-containing protein [Niastella caeni]|uniref:PKD domain-containing protein n=1 Tax=Niastella caeni TaxID=2569763 RepID=A0A4V4H1M4_9BACT|nr:PKD domain-containing protein [Niastella caeni]THU41056.1 PKD domain-containing protein [Niastella caeni]
MGRISLIALVLTIIALGTFAQGNPSTFEFTENKGQWESKIKFKGELPAGDFYLHPNGFTVVQHNTSDLERFFHRQHGSVGENTSSSTQANARQGKSKYQPQKPGNDPNNDLPAFTIRSHAYQVQFVGAAANAEIVPDKALSTYSNYLIGNDPTKWATNVKIYQAVLYKNVYPNIDVRYYSENGQLKYDLIVNPGGNVSNIQMRYEGADKLLIKNKELIIKTSVGDVKELYPYSYQFDQIKGKQETTCSYELADSKTVRFKVGNYSKTSTLIIDPTLIFSSFTGSRAGQYGFTATPGPDGSLYSGGIVFGNGFPVSPGAYQTSYQGGSANGGVDMGIFRFSPDGSQRMYATYLGAEGNDYPHSLISDAQGNLVIMGRTYSSRYPGTLIGPGGGADIAVTKLNAAGTAIIGSLRIGGTGVDGVNVSDLQEGGSINLSSTLRFYGDDSRSEVTLDNNGNVFVAAQSRSTDFRTTSGVFQAGPGGGQDGLILKIDPNCTSVTWSSYLGGSGDDGAFVIAVNPSNNDIYVGGATASPNFPGDKTGVYQSTNQGGTTDGFVAQISNDGSSIIRSSYMGTGSFDAVYGIKFDRLSIPYIMGVTEGSWPIINAAYNGGNSRQFVCKLRPDLSGFAYSTTFGNGAARPNISPVAFLVDRCENVYISGWGGWISTNGRDPFNMSGVAGMPTTPDALKTVTDNHDFYFIVIKKDAASLLYGSFFGQSGGEGEHVDGGTSRFDAQGVIYQAICANCFGSSVGNISVPYPITPGVWGPVNGTGTSNCNLAAAKIAFNFAGVASGPRPYFNGVVDSLGCVPFTVTLKDTILNAKSYEWSFGDGTPDVITSALEVTHTFSAIGSYRVRLIAIDSTTCNIRDTAYVTIQVRDDKANLAFLTAKLPPCQSLLYQFDNTTTFPPTKPFKASSFTWDFGDGTRVTPAPISIQHSYAAAGTYKTRLILNDTAYCNSPDSVEKELRVSPLVDARFETPPSGCAPYTAIFNNTSLAGQQFFWDFGDGTTSTEVNPVHVYNNIGNYRVSLVAIDSSTCNIIDSTFMDIGVHPLPTANFSFAPIPPQTNKPTVFTNLSSGGTRYVWLFGDGDSTVKTTMDTVGHQYNETGTFNACLVTFNEFGCSDTLCSPVEAIVDPLLDVPNAFTPGRFGRNSFINVNGFGIAKMTWRIYNRWGQMVFETNNRKIGWDGTFKGQPQPMDVYAYTLDVEFSDGRKLRKTGDITLIR